MAAGEGIVSTAGIEKLLDEVEWRELPLPHRSLDGLYATHQGVVEFGTFRLRCYTLNDGRRVFDADDMAAQFDGVPPAVREEGDEHGD